MGRPKIEVTANQVKAIISRYGKGLGLVEIGEDLKLGVQIVRRVLVEAKVKIRSRGRPASAE